MTGNSAIDEKQDYFRLIAFWVVCEAFAGGIIHAVKLPFSGMIVGSLAVFCIIMIGKNFPGKGNIIKATVLVCIFKLMLSPHSPPTAYIAVLFQGLVGELLFRLKLSLRLTAVLLAVLALVESSIQRILVLWILYGNQFWDAVGKYLEKFSGSEKGSSIPQQIAIGYISIHAVFGLLVGYYFAKLASADHPALQLPTTMTNSDFIQPRRKKKKIKWIFFSVWLILAAIVAYGYAYPQKALISGKSAVWIVFRAFTILLAWYFILSPLLMKWFRKKMEGSKTKMMGGFMAIESLLPSTKEIFYHSWLHSSDRKGVFRIHKFLQLLNANMTTRSSAPFIQTTTTACGEQQVSDQIS